MSYLLERREEPKHKRLLKTENQLRVDGGWEGGEGMGIEEGTDRKSVV